MNVVKAIAPGFGGINLEDIAAPHYFEIERRLQEELDIPVFHNDQHGTAVVVSSALINALKLLNKKPENIKVVVLDTSPIINNLVNVKSIGDQLHFPTGISLCILALVSFDVLY